MSKKAAPPPKRESGAVAGRASVGNRRSLRKSRENLEPEIELTILRLPAVVPAADGEPARPTEFTAADLSALFRPMILDLADAIADTCEEAAALALDGMVDDGAPLPPLPVAQ